MRTHIGLLFLCLLFTVKATAQQSSSFKHINVKEGLSNNFVLDMALDGQGFVWVATEAGLNRLTGDQCTVYKQNNSGLAGNEIQALLYVPQTNILWIGARENGISLFDCTARQFMTIDGLTGLFNDNINDLAPAVDGGIWILYQQAGAQYYDPTTNKLVSYHQDNVPELHGRNRCCMDDGNGHLYIGHVGEGMSVLDLKKGTIKRLRHRSGDVESLPGDNVRTIYMDHLKNIWVGTNQGLGLFNPLTEKFVTFKHNPKDAHSIVGDNIHGICEMNDHTLWIASDLGGISVLDLNKFMAVSQTDAKFRGITTANSGLSSPNTRILLQDLSGNVWIGNYSTGVDFIGHSQSAFYTLPYVEKQYGEEIPKRIYGIESDDEGNIWLGGENELSLCRENVVRKQWNLSSYQSIPYSMVYIIKRDRQGYVWLGINDEGVIRYDPLRDKFEHIDLQADYLDIHAFYEDEEGRMWIGTEDGIYSCYKNEVKKEDGLNRLLSSRTIYGITQDSRKQMWIGTLGAGVQVFDREGKEVAHLSANSGFCSSNINHIYPASDGSIWIATYNGLGYIKDISHPDRFEIFNEKQGLGDNHVRAIQEDRSGNIWISTYTGISCWNVRKERFDNYDYNNGIPMGSFVESSVCTAPNGFIYFGSPNGVCYFNPQLLIDGQQVAPVRIIACEGFNKQVEQRRAEALVPDGAGVINLPYNQNSFRISFAISDFSQAGQVDYAYMMEGLDEAWYSTEGDDQVTFRNISPGDYTFKVKARLRNQDWDEGHFAFVTVKVHPPLWFTWYAQLFYFALTVVTVFLLLRAYKRKLNLESSLELERRNSQNELELNNERLRFYTNITHELRTPLTLILGPLEDLMNDRNLSDYYSKKVNIIHDSAVRLLNLINQLLEFRKTETQNRSLTVTKGNLGSLVTEVGLRYKELNRNEKVQFHIRIETADTQLYFDVDIITTILDNLLSNAVKYTCEGEIRLTLRSVQEEGNKYVEINVSDTGYGIDAEALPHIFDRYYQAKGKHQASGTGIGLALVKSLADLHEGILSVESTVGKGTAFIFRLLTENTYPNALHKEEKDIVSLGEEVKEKNEREEINEENEDIRPVLLVVEDNADIREYIVTSFNSDYRIVEGVNGKDGLEKALKYIPNIIVSDIMMPEVDGIEFCRMVKEDVRTSHIPVILLTAKDSIQDKEEGYESGADSYLTKPFSAKLLRSRIRNLLESRRKLAQLIVGHTSEPASEELQDTIGLTKLDKEFLDKLTVIIEENLDAEKLDMAFMTDKLNMSHSAFYRKVKGLTGLSANEFIRKVKLKNSLRLLMSGAHNISETAYMTGFNNLGHFRECFKEEYGMTPSEYLKRKE